MEKIKKLREIIGNQLKSDWLAEADALLDQIEEQLKQNEVNVLTLKGIVAHQAQELKDFFEGVKEANKTQAA